MMSGISKFVITPALKAIIAESSRKVFGNLPVVNYRTGFKRLKQKPIGPQVIHHYAPDFTKLYKQIAPDYNTEEEDRRIEKAARLKRRGKVPPKKGQGKRAMRAKK